MGGGGGKGPSTPTISPSAPAPASPKAPTAEPESNPEAQKAADEMAKQEQLAKGRSDTIKTGKNLLSADEKETTKKKTLLGG